MIPTQPPPPSPLQKFRTWLRSDMLTLRWVFLGLYIALLLTPLFLSLFTGEVQPFLNLFVWLFIMLGAQALFIFGSGTIRLCFPIHRLRLILPIIVTATMFALLVAGLGIAMMELFKLDQGSTGDLMGMIFFSVVGLSWIGWGVLLYVYAKEWQRYRVLGRLSAALFAGSLAELLATVPSHVVVSRRPGCLVGLGTMLGIVAGLHVMLLSFGPMIVVLFLRPRYRDESLASSHICKQCGYDLRASSDRCPECGTPFTPSQVTVSLDPHAA